MQRLTSFLDPSADPLKSGYQVRQSLLALGRGGLFGVGAGNSVQKFSYLPEAHTDMIFAVLGEEFGLIGVALVVGLFAVFLPAALKLAQRCTAPSCPYLAAAARPPPHGPLPHTPRCSLGPTHPRPSPLTLHHPAAHPTRGVHASAAALDFVGRGRLSPSRGWAGRSLLTGPGTC